MDSRNVAIFDLLGTTEAARTFHPHIRILSTDDYWCNALNYALKVKLLTVHCTCFAYLTHRQDDHEDNLVMLRGKSFAAVHGGRRGTKRDAHGGEKKSQSWATSLKKNVEEHNCVDTAMELLWTIDPRVFMEKATIIKANLKLRIGEPPVVSPHPLSSFRPPWDTPFDFYVRDDGTPSSSRMSIVLYGASNTGKTVRALAEFERPLFITNSCVEQIGAAILAGPRAHTHMVFDEFHFRNAGKNGTPLTIEECIRLLDSEFVGQLSVRYKTITVPAIPRIFTTNLTLSCEADHIFPPPQNANHAEALARRYRRIRVDEPMYAAQGHDAPMAQPAQPVGL